MEANDFIILWWFLPYIDMSQPWVCAASFIAGVVMILCSVASETVHVAGLVMLGMGFVVNNQVRKFAPLLVKQEEEEEIHE